MLRPGTLTMDPPPIEFDADGVARVGGTRILLDLVIFAFNQGSSPEEIVLKYPSLNLPDVYAVATYYLQHRAEVDEYLASRERQAEEQRREIEASHSSKSLRELFTHRRTTGILPVGSLTR